MAWPQIAWVLYTHNLIFYGEYNPVIDNGFLFLFIGTSNEQFNKPKITVLVLISKISAFGHDREMFYRYQNFSKFQKYAKNFKIFILLNFHFLLRIFSIINFVSKFSFFTLILYSLYLVSILPELILNLRFFGFSQITLGGLEKKMKIFNFFYFASKKSDSLDANSNW